MIVRFEPPELPEDVARLRASIPDGTDDDNHCYDDEGLGGFARTLGAR